MYSPNAHMLHQKTPVIDPNQHHNNTSSHHFAHGQVNGGKNVPTPQHDYYSSSSFVKNDLTNLSNNLSLNLSIHTAEEFGIEMLEWLNNESNTNGHFGNGEQVKLANNATLV
jgi:hypothetical protein